MKEFKYRKALQVMRNGGKVQNDMGPVQFKMRYPKQTNALHFDYQNPSIWMYCLNTKKWWKVFYSERAWNVFYKGTSAFFWEVR